MTEEQVNELLGTVQHMAETFDRLVAHLVGQDKTRSAWQRAEESALLREAQRGEGQ